MLVAARRGEMVQQHSARQSAAVEAGKAVGQKVAEFVIGPWARIRAAQVETSRHVEGWP